MNKATILALVLLAVLAAGAVMVQHEMKSATERPAVQRQLSQTRLGQLAAALGTYRKANHEWPDTMGRLLRAANLAPTAALVRGAGTYHYRAPAADAPPGTVVVWSDRLHAGIKAGEPWGAEGQHAEHDIDPVGYVITVDGRVHEWDQAEWEKQVPKPVADEAPAGK
jgi:hypothetical protein